MINLLSIFPNLILQFPHSNCAYLLPHFRIIIFLNFRVSNDQIIYFLNFIIDFICRKITSIQESSNWVVVRCCDWSDFYIFFIFFIVNGKGLIHLQQIWRDVFLSQRCWLKNNMSTGWIWIIFNFSHNIFPKLAFSRGSIHWNSDFWGRTIQKFIVDPR